MEMITSVEQLSSVFTKQSAEKSAAAEESGLFENVFRAAIDNVKQTDAEKTEAEYLLATGQLDNPAALTIASTKNEIAVELLVQMRNKALDAYSEITRISL